MYLIGCKNLQSLGVSTTDLLYREYTTDIFGCFDDIDGLFKEQQMMALTPDGIEQELFGEAKAEKEEAPAPKVSFVTRLGAKIRELIAKFKEMVTKFMMRFKKEDEVMKQQQALIETAFRQDPSLKSQVIELAKSGNLNFTDIKNINELQSEVEKLMEEKDPKTLKGKFEKLKKKWDDPENTKTVKRVKAVGQVVALVTAVIGIGVAVSKTKNTIIGDSKKTQETLAAFTKDLDTLSNPTKSPYGDKYKIKNVNDIGLLKMKIAIHRYSMDKYGEAFAILSDDMSQVNGVLKHITKLVDSTQFAKNKQATKLSTMKANAAVMNIKNGAQKAGQKSQK